MKILIACEESQRLCVGFRVFGHEAYSCDIKPCSGGFPEWHIQDDALNLLKFNWDMIIAHPPCTFLTVTGNRWFNVEKYGNSALCRISERETAADFFMKFVNADCNKIVIENPVGCMSTRYRKPDQIVQPYFFGDPFEKRTCLWIKGLPLLRYTNIVQPEKRLFFESGKSLPGWYARAFSLPKEQRSELRSRTFPGIALAMVTQWG